MPISSTSWKKGKSPNPGGRTKADHELAARIRLLTKGGEWLANTLMSIALGEHPRLSSEESMRWALDMLLKRGFGLPAPAGTYAADRDEDEQTVIDTSRLSRDELALFAALMEKTSRQPDVKPEGGRVLPFPQR